MIYYVFVVFNFFYYLLMYQDMSKNWLIEVDYINGYFYDLG